MTRSQHRFYLFEWGRARRYFAARGLRGKELENRRHALHVQALGHDKSSKDLKNGEVAKVVAKFRAVWDGGNLDAQIDAINAPEERRQALLDRCGEAAGSMHSLGDTRLATEAACTGYIAGTARKVVGKEPADCNEEELGKVLGCLARRVGVLRRKNPSQAASLDALKREREMEQPF